MELGLVDSASVADLSISGNQILNVDAFGVATNRGTQINDTVRISGNTIAGNGVTMKPTLSAYTNNRLLDTLQKFDFESGASLDAWRIAACGSAQAGRLCNTGGAREGDCALQLVSELVDESGTPSQCRAEARTLPIPTSVGRDWSLTGWQLGNGAPGEVCLDFLAATGSSLEQHCTMLGGADGCSTHRGFDVLSKRSPVDATSVRVRIQAAPSEAALVVDWLRLSSRQ